MLKELFHQHLDQLGKTWDIASDMLVIKYPSKVKKRRIKENTEQEKYERTKPEKGYTVVLEHKPIAYACEWCEGTCSKEKTYSRSLGSNIWRAKCQDCGQRRNFHTSEINKNK